MRIDRDAASIVGDGQPVAGLERDLDPVGMTRDCLVHRVVDDLGGKVVERARIGAANIHAGAATHGLETFEYLDRGSIIIVGSGRF